MNNKSKYRARCNKQEDGDECRQRIAHRFWKMQFSTVQAAADDCRLRSFIQIAENYRDQLSRQTENPTCICGFAALLYSGRFGACCFLLGGSRLLIASTGRQFHKRSVAITKRLIHSKHIGTCQRRKNSC